MKRRNTILIRLSIILISFLLIDGGKTFIHAGFNIHFIIEHKHNPDLEIPNHGSFIHFADDQKWIESEFQQFLFSDHTCSDFALIQNFKTRDFSKSIWQPPKFI